MTPSESSLRELENQILSLSPIARSRMLRDQPDLLHPILAANDLDTPLKRVAVLNQAVRAFARRVWALRVFATVFGNVPLDGTDEVVVPYYPLDASASTDFNGTYAFGDTATDSRKLTINKRKYQSIKLTSSEFRRQPWLDVQQLATLKAEKLAFDVLSDIFSVVTVANYGAAVVTEDAVTFDVEEITVLKSACDKANWPVPGRGLILDSDYDSYLMRDNRLGNLNYASPQAIREGTVPRILGFDYSNVPNLPDNGGEPLRLCHL